MAKSDNHGGARKGAGAPPQMKDGRQVHLYLDADSVATATKAGEGNVSKGIRTALKAWEQRKDDDGKDTILALAAIANAKGA